MTEPLFKSAHEALTFAFNFSSQQAARSLMLQLAAPGKGGGKGLGGLDGAGQAGMIKQEVASLGRLHEAVLTARFAPQSLDCSCRSDCCSKKKKNWEWVHAVAWLADHMRTIALFGTNANSIMRTEYVKRYFTPKGAKTNLDKLADAWGVANNTVSAHNSRVVALFGGQPKKGEKEAIKGLDELAMTAAEDQLRKVGLI